MIAHFGAVIGHACWCELELKHFDAAATEQLNARLAGRWLPHQHAFDLVAAEALARVERRRRLEREHHRPELAGRTDGDAALPLLRRLLGDAVAERLRGRNVDPDSVEWDAWRREDGHRSRRAGTRPARTHVMPFRSISR